MTAFIDFTENPTPVVKHSILQNATFQYRLTVGDSEGNPADITDYQFYSDLKAEYSGTVAGSFSCRKVEPYTSGTLFLEMAPSGTAQLAAGEYFYDVIYQNGSEVRRILQGTACVSPGVTEVP